MDCCLSFCRGFIDHCIVSSSSNYGFLFPLRYLQTFRTAKLKLNIWFTQVHCLLLCYISVAWQLFAISSPLHSLNQIQTWGVLQNNKRRCFENKIIYILMKINKNGKTNDKLTNHIKQSIAWHQRSEHRLLFSCIKIE